MELHQSTHWSCDTPEEYRDTQMCRDTMVENHCSNINEIFLTVHRFGINWEEINLVIPPVIFQLRLISFQLFSSFVTWIVKPCVTSKTYFWIKVNENDIELIIRLQIVFKPQKTTFIKSRISHPASMTYWYNNYWKMSEA